MQRITIISVTLVLLAVVGSILLLMSSKQANGTAQSNDKQVHVNGEQNYRIISFDLPTDYSFAGEKVPMELFYVRESVERELIVNVYWHSSTLILLKRANRWLPLIEPILAENGIPNDFKFLCMIESNLINARSPAGAVGFWQFLEETAKENGLEVNKDVDERYHIEKSTAAACKYLLKAYQKYNNWALVSASYNAGTRRIDNFLREQQVDSYYDLLMADETERYLHRMIALKMIYENPERFGFFPEKERLYKPLPFKIINVDSSISNIATFAKEKGITYKLLKQFNPWLRSNQLIVAPNKSFALKLPVEPFNLTHARIKAQNSPPAKGN